MNVEDNNTKVEKKERAEEINVNETYNKEIGQKEAKWYSDLATFESPDFHNYLNKNYTFDKGLYPEKLSETGITFYRINSENYVKWAKEKNEEIKSERRLKVVYDKDLKNSEFKKIDWNVKGLIPEKSISILGGKRSTFKTITALDIACSISEGIPLFNIFETKKSKVLFLDEENGLPLIKERIRKIKEGLNIKNDCDIAFYSFGGFKLDSEDCIEKLSLFIEEYKPQLIIVDSFRRFIRFDENEAGHVSCLFTDILRPLTEKYGVSWLILHHARKGFSGKNPSDEMDELRGSSDLVNYADVVLMLQRNRNSNDSLILKQLKCRYQQEIPSKVIRLDWDNDCLKMECVGDIEINSLADEKCAEAIINWMIETEITLFETNEAIKAMQEKEYTKPTIERALRLLVDKAKLNKPQRGKYELKLKNKLYEFDKPSNPQNHPDGNEVIKEDLSKPSDTSNPIMYEGSMVNKLEEQNNPQSIKHNRIEGSDGILEKNLILKIKEKLIKKEVQENE